MAKLLMFAPMFCLSCFSAGLLWAGDLPEVQQNGVLRHLGVPYANFVTGAGDGLDVELVQRFAKQLGVQYEYVPTTWADFIGDLTGQRPPGPGVQGKGGDKVPVRGDIAAHGITVIPWRQQVLRFSLPTMPTQVWVLARADSSAKPIIPAKNADKDIAAVRALLRNKKILGIRNTCLDPNLFDLAAIGAKPVFFSGNLNEMAPALIKGEAEMGLLDTGDSLIALAKWPGKVKVIGPLTPEQRMAAACAPSSPQLVQAFNDFLKQCQSNGEYLALVKKYYPTITQHFPDFFKNMQ
jgi:ABC-type amino acid transport substrate-binding protein